MHTDTGEYILLMTNERFVQVDRFEAIRKSNDADCCWKIESEIKDECGSSTSEKTVVRCDP